MFVKRKREEFYNLAFLDNFMIGHKGFIAGGCFKNIFYKEKIKDIDVFLKVRRIIKKLRYGLMITKNIIFIMKTRK